MQLLSADTTPKHRIIPTDHCDVMHFDVRVKRFAFDTNSNALFLMDDEEVKVVYEGVKYKPVFPYYPLTQPAYLVMEACHACQFACKYCMVQQYYPGIDMLTLETAKEAIHLLFPDEQALQKASIGFFGGEPLLNWKLMMELTLYFEGLAHPRKPHFHVTTNAAAIDEAKAKFLSEHNYTVIVSLDGPEEVHNTNRTYKNGKGTFSDVMRGLMHLHKAGLGPRITLRATYTPETGSSLVKSVAFLNTLVESGFAHWVSVEPAFLTESMCFDPSQARHGITDVDIQELGKAYAEVGDWFVAQVKAGKRPVFHNITKTIERILWGLPYFTECGAGVGYLSVNSSGDIFPCHRESSGAIGNIHKGGVDDALQAKWKDNRGYLRESCMQCPIRYVCGSGCREESLNENKDIRVPFDAACKLRRIFFDTSAWVMSELSLEELKALVPMPKALQRKPAQDALNQPAGVSINDLLPRQRSGWPGRYTDVHRVASTPTQKGAAGECSGCTSPSRVP